MATDNNLHSETRELLSDCEQLKKQKEQIESDFIAAGGDPGELSTDSDSSTEAHIEELLDRCGFCESTDVHIKGVNSPWHPLGDTDNTAHDRSRDRTNTLELQPVSTPSKRDVATLTKEAKEMYEELVTWKFKQNSTELHVNASERVASKNKSPDKASAQSLTVTTQPAVSVIKSKKEMQPTADVMSKPDTQRTLIRESKLNAQMTSIAEPQSKLDAQITLVVETQSQPYAPETLAVGPQMKRYDQRAPTVGPLLQPAKKEASKPPNPHEMASIANPSDEKTSSITKAKFEPIPSTSRPVGVTKPMSRTSQRLSTETAKRPTPADQRQTELGKKLKRLLCANENDLEGEIFHVVIANAMQADLTDEEMNERFAFLKELDQKAVFDFDPEGKLFEYVEEHLHQNMNLFSVEDFDPGSQQDDRTRAVFRDTDSADNNIWIVANGNKKHQIEVCDNVKKWKKTRSQGFKEITRRMQLAIPRGRVVVVFMLLSEHYPIMLKVSDDLITGFGSSWFTITETEEIAKDWMRHLDEDVCEDDELQMKSIVGLSWTNVNRTVLSLADAVTETPCQLPTSDGQPVVVDENVRKRWTDIDILGSNQCQNLEEEVEKRKIKITEDYFQGGDVDWWNFQCGDVLPRTEFQPLKDYVCSKLQSKQNDSNYVEMVTLFHQPGAGGTSTASQVLWELKQEYRCAVVKKITEGQTCDEITDFFTYKDAKRPKPVLLLFDNHEEEKVSILKAELEGKAKSLARHTIEDPPPIFYLFLQCVRQTILNRPPKSRRWYFAVVQQLDKGEKRLFGEKSKALKLSFRGNPTNLISFNIMKESFNKEYMESTVEELLSRIDDVTEITLLKYLALLNCFDLSFRALPVTVFDAIMAPSAKPTTPVLQWERRISQPLHILLFRKKKKKDCHRIRVCHNALSLIILQKLLERTTQQKQMFYEVLHEFLDYPGIFDREKEYLNKARRFVLNVVCEIVKKRRRDFSTGRPETRFACLIESIQSDSGNEKAADVLTKVYDLSNDLFVGQQLARFYIQTQNWQRARSCAHQLVETNNRNSYLLDTLGQTYKMEVVANYQEVIESASNVEVPQALHIMDLAFKAINIFQKEQSVSEGERSTSYPNDAGYFNELSTIIFLLDTLILLDVMKDPGTIQRILSGKPVPRDVLDALKERNVHSLQKLQGNVRRTIIKLKDEFQQLKVDRANEFLERKIQTGTNMVTRYNEHLSSYFLELEEDTRRMSEEERCRYRRCKSQRLAGYTFKDMIKLGNSSGGLDKVHEVCAMMEENMKTRFREASDLKTFLSAKLTACAHKEKATSIDLYELAEVSKELYDCRMTCKERVLEPYLFVTMFNWPQFDSTPKKPLTIHDVRHVIANWKDAYYDKYPQQRPWGKSFRKRDTTVAFLGVGENKDKFVFPAELPEGSRFNENVREFWQRWDVVDRLQRWQGVLINDGCDVQFQLSQNGVNEELIIPTSFPVTKHTWHRKRVFVVIGFTWAGPRAFDVTQEDPRANRTQTEPCRAEDHLTDEMHTIPRDKSMLIQLPPKINNEEFLKQYLRLRKKLSEIRLLRAQKQMEKYHKQEKTIQEEIDELVKSKKENYELVHNLLGF